MNCYSPRGLRAICIVYSKINTNRVKSLLQSVDMRCTDTVPVFTSLYSIRFLFELSVLLIPTIPASFLRRLCSSKLPVENGRGSPPIVGGAVLCPRVASKASMLSLVALASACL